MSKRTISPRHNSAILQAFSNGVTPRIGLEHVVVGRSAEVEAILDDLDYRVAKGGASFRLLTPQNEIIDDDSSFAGFIL